MSTTPRPAGWPWAPAAPDRRWLDAAGGALPAAGADPVARLRLRAPVVVGVLVAAVVPAVLAETQLVVLSVLASVLVALLGIDLLLGHAAPVPLGRTVAAGVATVAVLGLVRPGLAPLVAVLVVALAGGALAAVAGRTGPRGGALGVAVATLGQALAAVPSLLRASALGPATVAGHGQAYRAWLVSLALLAAVGLVARRRPGPVRGRALALLDRAGVGRRRHGRDPAARPGDDPDAGPGTGHGTRVAGWLERLRRRPRAYAAIVASAALAVVASVANDARTLELAGGWSPWWLVAALVLLVVWPFTVWFAPAGTGVRAGTRPPADRRVPLAVRDLLVASGRDGSWRVSAGLTLLVLGAVLALVGYVRLWSAAELATQLIRLAGTAVVVVPLSVAGGALVVTGRLRADERRLRALEAAVAGGGPTARPTPAEAVPTTAVPPDDALSVDATRGAVTAGAAPPGAAVPRGARRPDAG